MSEEKEVCGIVMPISAMDDCAESHWSEVLAVISDSVDDAGFSANLVSNADEVGLIHKRIIQNLYDNPVVVCDVSCKNANVMFELGLRLAFDKPTIIIKDDQTSYSFDTSAIEHIEYPRDMRFAKIVEFKKKLSEKIKATFEKSQTDPNHTTFLKHFGEFKVAKLDKKEVSGEEFIIEELKSIRTSMNRLERNNTLRENQFVKNYRTDKWYNARAKESIHSDKSGTFKTIATEGLQNSILEKMHEGWSQEQIVKYYTEKHLPENLVLQIIEEQNVLQKL